MQGPGFALTLALFPAALYPSSPSDHPLVEPNTSRYPTCLLAAYTAGGTATRAPEEQAILGGHADEAEEKAAAQLASRAAQLAAKEGRLAAMSEQLTATEMSLMAAEQQQQQQGQQAAVPPASTLGSLPDSAISADRQAGSVPGISAARWSCLAAQRAELAARWQCLAEERRQLGFELQQRRKRRGGCSACRACRDLVGTRPGQAAQAAYIHLENLQAEALNVHAAEQ